MKMTVNGTDEMERNLDQSLKIREQEWIPGLLFTAVRYLGLVKISGFRQTCQTWSKLLVIVVMSRYKHSMARNLNSLEITLRHVLSRRHSHSL
jgi:hypothetical protein